MPKLSIIVPVYNVEKYIERCLNTLVNQTLQDIEIIIVNDGSTDKSKEIIKKYLKKYSEKIQYYEKENGGLSSARNFGLNYAKGEYIAFLDSDDYVELNMYEEMFNLAKEENADMVECDFLWEWKKNERNEKHEKDEKNENYSKIRILRDIVNKLIKRGKDIKVRKNTREAKVIKVSKDIKNENNIRSKKDIRKNYKDKTQMMKRPRVVAWNKIYKREMILKTEAQFPEGLIYEDLEFFYKIIPFVNKTSYINKYFVHYIQRENSISNTQTEKNADIFKILQNIFDFYKEKNLYNEYKRELKSMSRRILLGSSFKRTMKIKDVKLRRKIFLKTILFLMKYCL